MSVVDDVKQKLDIVEVIGQYASLTKAGQTFRALCPFHSEKHPSFFVYPGQQSWHCFGACNQGGDVFSFVMKKEGIDFGEALRLLAGRAGVTVSEHAEREARGKDRLFQVNQQAAEYYHGVLLKAPAAEKARQYLSRRGLTPKAIADFMLGYCLDSWDALKQELTQIGYNESELVAAGLLSEKTNKTYDRFRDKLMFPVLDERARVTGFGARVLDDSLPKYINSPQTPVFDKSSSLYGIHLAREAVRKGDLAIIVEGYMDVIAAHQHGFCNVIAAMGTSVTEKHLATIKKLTRNLALALDSDAAGEGAMLRGASYENGLGGEVRVILLPPGKDPDEVIKEDGANWERLVSGALPVFDYTFKMVTAGLDLTKARDKSLAVDKLLPMVSDMRDSIRRGQYVIKLAELIGASHEDMEAALSRLKPDRRARETRAETNRRALRPLLAPPMEDDCLALLLQHPELKAHCHAVSPEHFESSQNREIFMACQQSAEPAAVREKLDSSLYEQCDALMSKSLRATDIEHRWQDFAFRLRERYLRRLELMKAEVLASAGGAGADLAKLEEQGMEVSVQLRDLDQQRKRRRVGDRGGQDEPG